MRRIQCLVEILGGEKLTVLLDGQDLRLLVEVVHGCHVYTAGSFIINYLKFFHEASLSSGVMIGASYSRTDFPVAR